MKRDLWKELLRRAQFSPAPELDEAPPFAFTERLLQRLARDPAAPFQAWTIWVPFLRPALACSFVVTALAVWMVLRSTEAPSRDVVIDTDKLIEEIVAFK